MKNVKAFPIVYNNTGSPVDPGMYLRDYFAAKAMQAFIHEKGLTTRECTLDTEGVRTDVVDASFAMADAMMKAREE